MPENMGCSKPPGVVKSTNWEKISKHLTALRQKRKTVPWLEVYSMTLMFSAPLPFQRYCLTDRVRRHRRTILSRALAMPRSMPR
jgi:hypothetical protein